MPRTEPDPGTLDRGDAYSYAKFFNLYRQDNFVLDNRDIYARAQTRFRDCWIPRSERIRPAEIWNIPAEYPARGPTSLQEDFIRDGPPVPRNENEDDFWFAVQNWKGIKVLGEGGNGLAGLFERKMPDGTTSRIVIKIDTAMGGFDSESEIMHVLQSAGRQPHIVQILSAPRFGITLRSISLEFCQNGDLDNYIINCRNSGQTIPEKDMWSVFHCLIRAVTVLDRGSEDLEAPNTLPNGFPIVHFDIKPMNIFRGGNDGEHQDAYVHKLGDYGLARPINPTSADWNLRFALRRIATFGYYAPEQFTERWDFQDGYDAIRIAGNYGTHTNIWGMAAIMWQLALLTGPPPAQAFVVDNATSPYLNRLGNTYGRRLLRPGGYSNTLKELILKCLCENPANRPSLADLHANILRGIQQAAQPQVGLPGGNGGNSATDEPHTGGGLSRDEAWRRDFRSGFWRSTSISDEIDDYDEDEDEDEDEDKEMIDVDNEEEEEGNTAPARGGMNPGYGRMQPRKRGRSDSYDEDDERHPQRQEQLNEVHNNLRR